MADSDFEPPLDVRLHFSEARLILHLYNLGPHDFALLPTEFGLVSSPVRFWCQAAALTALAEKLFHKGAADSKERSDLPLAANFPIYSVHNPYPQIL